MLQNKLGFYASPQLENWRYLISGQGKSLQVPKSCDFCWRTRPIQMLLFGRTTTCCPVVSLWDGTSPSLQKDNWGGSLDTRAWDSQCLLAWDSGSGQALVGLQSQFGGGDFLLEYTEAKDAKGNRQDFKNLLDSCDSVLNLIYVVACFMLFLLCLFNIISWFALYYFPTI